MSKPIIAVDIDDVLAAEAAFIVAYSNKHWHHRLDIDDYQEFWEEMWGVDHDEAERRSLELHQPGIEGSYEPLDHAQEVLEHLSERFTLVVVTSRRELVRQETLDWLERNMGSYFSEIIFSGIWDSGNVGAHKLTKTEILQSVGAAYLIDDQLKHCAAAAEAGITAVLFGNYPWNQTQSLPSGVYRCDSWQAVQEYFDGRKD
jgi:5'(3')-deoxyribonucleotidase